MKFNRGATGMKHKHAELIKAWADGAEIQVYKPHWDEWHDCQTPIWDSDEYRLKPAPKPDWYRFYKVAKDGNSIYPRGRCEDMDANLRLYFDGKTGELKSAEVLR